MNVQVGVPIPIKIDTRYVKHIREHAIGDVFDALVELITNADDSYGRLFQADKRKEDGGNILIECLEQRKGRPSIIIVRDRAEGMNARDMEAKLAQLGTYSSSAGARGYMGRGAKDCSALGEVIVDSIEEERHFRCRITNDLKFILDIENGRVMKDLRSDLGIPRGNGTSVTLKLDRNVRFPRFENLAAELPWHYALRDILAEDSASRVLCRKIGPGDPNRLIWHPPVGELVADESYSIDGYPSAKASLKIWRSPEPLADSKPRFERWGLLIKAKRAIHECSLLSDEFKKDPYARHYFGRLECPYLDELLAQYEVDLQRGRSHPPENPRLVIDPNRRFGLERRHPFVPALLQKPIERLRALLARDRERERLEHSQVANEETRERLDRLGKLASQFLREQLDELDELSPGEDVEKDAFAKQGVLLYPTYLRVGVGNERVMTMYVKRAALAKQSELVAVTCDCPGSLEVVGSPFALRSHRSKDDRLVGNFKVRGRQPQDNVVVKARCPGLPPAEALASVVALGIEDRVFTEPLEFEHTNYRVRQGRSRSLRLFAKYPEVISKDTVVRIESSAPGDVVVHGRCKLVPIPRTNYAEGDVRIEGRTLNASAEVKAEITNQSVI